MKEHQARIVQSNLTTFVAGCIARQPCHTDESIEYWADVYRTQGLDRLGIRFELFVQMPTQILARLEDVDVKQRLRDMIDSAEAECNRQVRSTCQQPGNNTPQRAQVHGGRLMQPMAPRNRYGRGR